MKNHYEKLLEKELKRLWINDNAVVVISNGKDNFTISDGKRYLYSKGHLIYKHTKTLPNCAGYDKFWNALKSLEHRDKPKI